MEHVSSERDAHSVQEEELLAHTRLLSSDAKDWKSKVVSEVEQVLVCESAEAIRKATEVQEPLTSNSSPMERSRGSTKDVRE